MNSRKKWTFLIIALAISLVLSLFGYQKLFKKDEFSYKVNYGLNYNKNDDSVIIDNNNLKNFNNIAVLIGDGTGRYTESNTWPSSLKYVFNTTLSKCYNKDDDIINNALEYNKGVLKLVTNTTSYCYLYFDLDIVLPVVNNLYINNNDAYTTSNVVNVSFDYVDNDVTHYCIIDTNSSSKCTWVESKDKSVSTAYTLAGSEGLKYVYVYLKDVAGNISEAKSDSISYDKTAPTNSSVSINSGASYTTSATVTLTLSSSGATKMCISNTTSCTSWVDYTTSKSWTLSSGDGNKTVYVWFKDNAGNVTSSYVSDGITLDTSGPSNNSIKISGDATYTQSTSVTLTLSSTGATKMCISNTTSCSNYVDYATSKSWTLSSGDGTKTVYVWFKDSAGNVANRVSDTIVLDASTPSISRKAASYNFNQGTNKAVSELYTVTYGPSSGSTVCKVGTTTVTNISSLAVGTHSLVCTATSGAGKTASVTITLNIYRSSITLNFDSASDLNYFTLSSNSYASVTVSNGFMVQSSSRIDNSINVTTTPAKLNMQDINYIEFKMNKTAAQSGVFPHLRVRFADGKRFHYILMNNFIWSGYYSWYGQALYQLGYNSMWAFGNNAAMCYQSSECSDQTVGVYGSVCSAPSHTTAAVYKVSINKSTGVFSIYNGYCNTTVSTQALTTSKISSIDFNFQDDWFNNSHSAKIDYIILKNQ